MDIRINPLIDNPPVLLGYGYVLYIQRPSGGKIENICSGHHCKQRHPATCTYYYAVAQLPQSHNLDQPGYPNAADHPKKVCCWSHLVEVRRLPSSKGSAVVCSQGKSRLGFFSPQGSILHKPRQPTALPMESFDISALSLRTGLHLCLPSPAVPLSCPCVSSSSNVCKTTFAPFLPRPIGGCTGRRGRPRGLLSSFLKFCSGSNIVRDFTVLCDR